MRPLELGLRGRERLGRKAREAHEIDAEAGVDRVLLRARELFGEQADDRARFVERPGGADPDAAHVAVDAIEAKLDPPRPLRLPLEQHDEIVGELAQGRLDRLDRLHGRGEAPLGAEIGRGEARRDRGALEALERVEPGHRERAEPRRDRRAGPEGDVADALQAGPRHVGDGVAVEAEGGERQVVEELCEGLVAQILGRDLLARKAGERPGGARIAGDAGRGRDAERGEAADASVHQRLFAAEEMRHARNVEHQAVGAIEGGERGEARAPVAQALEKPRLFRRVRLDRDEGGMARARVRQRQAGRQAEPRGVRVDADEPLGVLDPGDRRERRALVNGLEPPGAVRRQTRQPEREKSPGRQKSSPRFAIRA